MNQKEPILSQIKLIIGLGNPGKEYEKTFHNAGFLALDHSFPDLNYQAKTIKKFTWAKQNHLLLVKSLTFMNESGSAVQNALNFFKIAPSEMLVIHDDSDLPLGSFKVEFGRSSAGHNGINSIINSLQTKDFWRMRLGIRTKPGKASDFVLENLKPEQLDELYGAIEAAFMLTKKDTPSGPDLTSASGKVVEL